MNTFNFKTLFIIILQGLGAMLAFVVSLIIANMLLPLSPEISAAGQTATGFLAPPLAFLFNAFVNALILVWAARRSSFKGMALFGQLLVLSFGAQVFMTQIETGYFLPAFPLLRDNFQLYSLVLRGFVTSLLFALVVRALCGGSVLAVVVEGVRAVEAIQVVNTIADLSIAPFQNGAIEVLQDQCILRQLPKALFKGATHFTLDCMPATVAVTRDCWDKRCRFFITDVTKRD